MTKDKPSRLDEASAWFAAIRKSAMPAEERAAFDAWRADPRNQAALDELHQLWGELAVLKYLDPNPLDKPKRAGWIVAAAASVLVVVGGASLVWMLPKPMATIATAIGEQRTQTLADGSVLAVNVVSRVTYDSQNARLVDLQEGEAAFSVRRDAARPFLVRAGAYTFRAVGTSFNVRRRDGTIEIAVAQGRVDICLGSDADNLQLLADLGAGAMLRLPEVWSAEFHPGEPASIPLSDVAEWRMRAVSYDNARLGEVVADFNRYFTHKLATRDPQLLDRRVTIRLQIEDRQSAVATLAALLNLRLEEASDATFLRD
ncbi:MAG: FecR domain-containing protein [Hyphomonadaceae bacterium]